MRNNFNWCAPERDDTWGPVLFILSIIAIVSTIIGFIAFFDPTVTTSGGNSHIWAGMALMIPLAITLTIVGFLTNHVARGLGYCARDLMKAVRHAPKSIRKQTKIDRQSLAAMSDNRRHELEKKVLRASDAWTEMHESGIPSIERKLDDIIAVHKELTRNGAHL